MQVFVADMTVFVRSSGNLFLPLSFRLLFFRISLSSILDFLVSPLVKANNALNAAEL